MVIRLTFVPQIQSYQAGRESFAKNIPTSYPFTSVNNVQSQISDREVRVSFNLAVKQSGEYSIIGEVPCYDQVDPPTQAGIYGTPQVSRINLVADTPSRIDFLFQVQSGKQSYGCPMKEPWFEFTLNPNQSGVFGKDSFVIFSGFLERIKVSGFDNQRSGYPYIYVPEFLLRRSN